MLQEFVDNLQAENNNIRNSFSKMGEESVFIMDKVREMATQLEEGSNEKEKLLTELNTC